MQDSNRQANPLMVSNKNSPLCDEQSLLLPKIQSSEPLWKRVPTRDPSGKPYNDFMMIIPNLKKFERSRLNSIVNKINAVLKLHEQNIVLADLNLKINVLWVTIQPQIGLTTEIAAHIHHLVPEAKLVSQHHAP